MSSNDINPTAAPPLPGDPISNTNATLETGASALQSFKPLTNICAHLNALHTYASDPGRRFVETNHYCAHLTQQVRQCLLYDRATADARLIGVEYMITPDLFSTLDSEEKGRWHSHVFEVKSGMLVMPAPANQVPGAAMAWEAAETKEMEGVVELYGKVYHLWQTDRGDALPIGEPQLMTSFTDESQIPKFEEIMDDRDERMGTDWRRARKVRDYIREPKLDEGADKVWKERRNSV